jgi:cytidylate kinase
VAPLKPADDAVIVDSTGTPITEVIERVLAVLPEKLRPPRQD